MIKGVSLIRLNLQKCIIFICICIIIFFAAFVCVHIKKDSDIIKKLGLNLDGVEECYYSWTYSGNPISIGPVDYEYFIFAKLSNDKLKDLKSDHSFFDTKANLEFYDNFLKLLTSKVALKSKNYSWKTSNELKHQVLNSEAYMSEIYFDTLNGYVYIHLKTY